MTKSILVERRSLWLVAALVGFTAFSEPAPAQAQCYGCGLGDGLAVAGGVIGGLVIGVPSLIFTVADIVSYAGNTPFATGWAVLETIVASLSLATAIIWASIAFASSDGVAASFAVIPLVLGGSNLAHAIWSFATLDSGPVYSYVAPQQDGCTAGLAGAF